MPASPFGLAYGLGVAANAIPTQMNERANMDLQMRVRQLQLAQMQRQEEEQNAIRDAALNIRPETEVVASLSQENAPQGLNMLPASPEVQASARGLNLPAPRAIPNAPTDQQMASIQKPLSVTQRAKVYSSPYQAAAHRLGAMSDYLFKQGMVEPAMRLQQQASQANQMHIEKTGQDAAKLLSMGSKDAIPLLKALGVNAVDVGKDKEGVSWIKDEGGNFTPIDYEDLAAIASDGKNLGAVFAKMASAESRLYGLEYSANMRAKIAANELQRKKEALEKTLQEKRDAKRGEWGNRVEVQRLKNAGAARVYGAGGKTPAKLAIWERAVADTRKMHPTWGAEAVLEEAGKHPLVATAASLKRGDPAGAYRILLSKQMEDAEDEDHPLHDLYLDAKAEIEEWKKKKGGTKSSVAKLQYGPTGPNGEWIVGDVSPDGKKKIVEGKGWVKMEGN